LAQTGHGRSQADKPVQPQNQRGRRFGPWILFMIITVAVLAVGCGSSTPKVAATIPTLRSAAEKSPLKCQAWAGNRRPRAHTTVKIQVRTAAHAWVTATHALALLKGESASGRAGPKGQWAVRFRVSDATPGARVVITVGVSYDGRKGTCQASFQPQSAQTTGVAVPAQPATPPSPAPPPPPSSAPSPPPVTAASCHPLSNEGTCYEPGEFCRNSDHGASGVAGDGENIICEYNNGWRWEPA